MRKENLIQNLSDLQDDKRYFIIQDCINTIIEKDVINITDGKKIKDVYSTLKKDFFNENKDNIYFYEEILSKTYSDYHHLTNRLSKHRKLDEMIVDDKIISKNEKMLGSEKQIKYANSIIDKLIYSHNQIIKLLKNEKYEKMITTYLNRELKNTEAKYFIENENEILGNMKFFYNIHTI
jgi:hypothetical protein